MLKLSLWAVALSLLLSAPAHSGKADLGYDPKADPFAQYHAAIDTARAQNKLVLIIAGGDWCRWCHVLNRFIGRNDDVQRGLEDTFVTVKVYLGEENTNAFFFDQLPRAYGAPHFWVVAPDRTVLGSQSTAPFEAGRNGYDKQRFMAFVQRWSTQRDEQAQLHAEVEP